MRGYATTLLVLASVFLLTNLLVSFHASSGGDRNREIAVSRAYQLQLNMKDLLLEAAKTGAREGFDEYMAVCTAAELEGSGRCEHSNAREAAILGSQRKMNELQMQGYDPDFESRLWCGVPIQTEYADLKRRMAMEKKTLVPFLSFPLDSQECLTVIDARITQQFILESVGYSGTLEGSDLPASIGVSVYSEKFAVSGIGHVPQSERRFFD